MIPLGDLVLVKPNKEDNISDSGLILPKDDVYATGTAVSVGGKVQAIKNGNTIKYFKGKGVEVEYRGDDMLLLRESTEIVDIL